MLFCSLPAQLLSAQLVLRTELLSARITKMKTRLTQFAPLTKEHRKLMNEVAHPYAQRMKPRARRNMRWECTL